MNQAAPARQRRWDWRAAGNFIGGSGAGVLVGAALARAVGAPAGRAPTVAVALGLIVIAAGLTSVWLEIGRPLRALNVFRQPRQSWMTRESWVAAALFVTAAAGLWSGSTTTLVAAAVLGLGFLYCQGRILAAAKGIPAWREPRIVPFILATGIAEGTGLFALVTVASGPVPAWLPLVLIVLPLCRGGAFQRYHRALRRSGAPTATLAVLDHAARPFLLYAVALPAALAILSFVPGPAGVWLVALSGVTAFVGGAAFKYTLVVHAAFDQGFALPHLPTRGASLAGAATKPGWRMP